MRKILGWMAVMALCCATRAWPGEPPPDARLQEAQKAYDEAIALDKAGKYAEAVAQTEQALALREAVLGGTHPAVADCLDLLGTARLHQEDLKQAEPPIQRALAIREAALGKSHPDVATSLTHLALVYKAQRQPARAEPFFERALAIRESVFGQNHPEVATSLNNLANLYMDLGLFGKAEPLYLRALAIREAALDKNHLDIAQSLNTLAILYVRQSLYSQAQPLFERALAIREAALGPNHPDVATSLTNLALLYDDLGLYERAEPLFERGLAIRESVFGKNHLTVTNSLNNLAGLYYEQGMYARAEPLYQRSLEIREAALGKDHPDVATALNNLANLYTDLGLFGKAESLHLRALDIREAALGKTHLLVAQSLHNLAIVYRKQELFGKAEPLFKRALAIQEGVLGKNHPEVASTLNSLANVYFSQGLPEKAEPLHQRDVTITEATQGKNHPNLGVALHSLALDKLAQHRLGEALPLLTRALVISEQRLRHEALGLSESRLASLLQLLHKDEERFYMELLEAPGNARFRRLALSAALLLKGRSVEETANISRAIYLSLGSQERGSFERLRALRAQLAERSLQGPGSLPPADYQHQLQALSAQGDALEAELAQRSAPLRALTALPSPADIVDRVAQALPKQGALVEFISYEYLPLPKAELHPSGPRYLALVLFPDGSTGALDLGPAEPIDSAASSLRAALANRDAAFQAKAQALYQLVFQPLLPLLGKTRRLFLSPDSQLAQVPFAALHDGHQFLVEDFDFTYLTSGKDLLPRIQEPPSASSVVVLADPDFNAPLASPAPSTSEASGSAERSASLERFFSSLGEDPAHRAWTAVPLPGTRKEAAAIQRLLPQAQLFLGAEASKQRLLHLASPGVLHLATHGFFLGDTTTATDSRGVVEIQAMDEPPTASRPPDPLLRSGLLLAGAGGSHQASPADSVVTALELAGLDLWGTQLVVLSACDTGRGDVKTGQGVYGLRRAFMVAGAETMVTSLWKVDDETTSALMEAYYRNLLAGQGRASALREAMRALRKTQPHPHYWAPFIVLGRDTPLQGLTPNPSGRAQ